MLLSAWTGLGRGDEVRELRPWLHRIVHNTALNALRVAGYDYDELRETLEGRGGPAELAERRRGALAGRGDVHGDEDCAPDALAIGAVVEEAELRISSAGRVWKEIELR